MEDAALAVQSKAEERGTREELSLLEATLEEQTAALSAKAEAAPTQAPLISPPPTHTAPLIAPFPRMRRL